MKFRGAASALIVLIAAACTSAPAREVKEPDIYQRPGIRDYEHISAVTSDHRVEVFYERVTWANIHAWSDAWWWGQVDAWTSAYVAGQVRQVAEQVQSYAPRSGGINSSGGGDCYSRKPAGFPDYVIDRESGGDPNATNGAHDGCAQIADSHFNGGACSGMSYDACWSKLWNGGAGASNWSQTL